MLKASGVLGGRLRSGTLSCREECPGREPINGAFGHPAEECELGTGLGGKFLPIGIGRDMGVKLFLKKGDLRPAPAAAALPSHIWI